MTPLTHIDEQGNTRMVNVADKAVTKRQAVAAGRVVFPDSVFETLLENQGMTKKGSILEVAKVAGIMAAKNTSNLIPMCHPMMLEQCDLNLFFNPDRNSIEIEATVGVTHKTGVEMEALTAVSVAALTVYDMTKALSHEIVIQNVLLRSKTGGRSGTWQREGEVPAADTVTSNMGDGAQGQAANGEGAKADGAKAAKPRRTEAASKAAQELSQSALNTLNGALERLSGVVTEVKSKVHTTMSQLREKSAEEAATKKTQDKDADEIQKAPLDTAPDAPVSRVSLLRKRKAEAKPEDEEAQPIDEITVSVLYFAELQAASKKESEPVTLAASATPKDLYTLLKARYHFEREADSLLVSINDAFAQWDSRLKEGDKVAFIPPISGG